MPKNDQQTEEKVDDDQFKTYKNDPSKSSLLDLPPEILRHVFSFFPEDELAKAGGICKATHTHSRDLALQKNASKSKFQWKHDGHTNGFDNAKEISCIAPFSENLILISSYDGTVRVWNLNTHRCDYVLSAKKGYISFVAKLSDTKIVCGCQDNALQVWDFTNGQVETIPTDCHMPACGLVLASGEVLSASYSDIYGNRNGRIGDGTLRLWNLATRKGVNLGGAVNCLLQTSKGTIISGSQDKKVVLWQRDKHIKTLSGCGSAIIAVAELSDSRIVAVDENSIIYVWDRARPSEPKLMQSDLYKVNPIIGITVLSNDILLCISASMHTFWDLDVGICLKEENRTENLSKAVLITEDGRLIMGTKTGDLIFEALPSFDLLPNRERANSEEESESGSFCICN